MKKVNLIFTLCIIPLLSFGGYSPNNPLRKLTDVDRYNMSVEFLKNYAKDFSIINWKIKVKENKVVMKKYGSLESISLYNDYFIARKEKVRIENLKSGSN